MTPKTVQRLDHATFKQRVQDNAPKNCKQCGSASRAFGVGGLFTLPAITLAIKGTRDGFDKAPQVKLTEQDAKEELGDVISKLCDAGCVAKQHLEISIQRLVIEFLVGIRQQTPVEIRTLLHITFVQPSVSAYSLRFPSKAARLAKLLGSPEIRILRDIEDSKGDLKGIMAWEFMALCRVLDVFDRNKLISPALDPSFYRQDPASAKTTAVQEFDKSKTIRDLLVLAHAFESRSETPEATSTLIKSTEEAVFLLAKADRIQNPNKYSITDQLSAVTELIEFVNNAEAPLLERLEGIARACGGLKMLCAGEQFLHAEFSRRVALDKK